VLLSLMNLGYTVVYIELDWKLVLDDMVGRERHRSEFNALFHAYKPIINLS